MQANHYVMKYYSFIRMQNVLHRPGNPLSFEFITRPHLPPLNHANGDTQVGEKGTLLHASFDFIEYSQMGVGLDLWVTDPETYNVPVSGTPNQSIQRRICRTVIARLVASRTRKLRVAGFRFQDRIITENIKFVARVVYRGGRKIQTPQMPPLGVPLFSKGDIPIQEIQFGPNWQLWW